MTLLSGAVGALMPLAFAPFYWWWLAPLVYAALFLCWRDASPGQAFCRGLAFGFSGFLIGVYWIYISVHQFAGAPAWLAIMMLIGLALAMAMYPALVGWLAARFFTTRGAWHWLLGLPALWVLAEWLRSFVLTGFGWLAPGYSQTESWLFGFAPLVGVLGISWATLVVAGAVALAIDGDRRQRALAASVTIALFCTGFLSGRIDWTTPRDTPLTVALAQGAVPQDLKWRPEQLPVTLDLYRDLTLEALGTDLIVWPEAAIPQYYENLERWTAGIQSLAADAGSEIMLGMLRYHEAGAQNAVYTLSQPESPYVKRHLVPYGEYFPVPDFIRPWLAAMDLAFIDTRPGDPAQAPIGLLGERIAVTICYEDVFGAEQLHSFPDATLLVNVSNDAWFGDSIAPHQHLQIARMRSAEVRRWQLRATNTGLTALIDPHGELAASLPQFEPGVLRGTVPGMTGSTPYIVWGDFAVVLLAAVAVAVYRLRTKLTIRPGT